MPRKRKLPSPVALTDDSSKKHRPQSTLTRLPAEILHSVILYSLPNPTDWIWSVQSRGSSILLTSPILQTCTILRQEGFNIINKDFIWTHINVPSREIEREFAEALNDLPLVPKPLRGLIDSHIPKVCLNLEFTRSYSRQNTRSFNNDSSCFVLPCNFSSLLRVCFKFNQIAASRRTYDETRLSVMFRNLRSSQLEQAVSFLVPVVSTMSRMPVVTFEKDTEAFIPENLGKFMHEPLDSIVKFTERIKELLRQVNDLREASYNGEADVLLLASDLLARSAKHWVPRPTDWGRGETDTTLPLTLSQVSSSASGRSPLGNQLRKLLHQLEFMACLAFARRVEMADVQDGEVATWDRYEPERRFWNEPHGTWFGMSLEDMAKLHYGRARLFGAVGKYRWKRERSSGRPWIPMDDADEISSLPTLFIDALAQIWFSHLLDPKNGVYQRMYCRYMDLLKPRLRTVALENIQRQFVLISDNSSEMTKDIPLWAGEWEMIKRWGGERAVVQWLHLAQKGVFDAWKFDEWIENLSVEQRIRYLRQGREYQEKLYDPWSVSR